MLALEMAPGRRPARRPGPGDPRVRAWRGVAGEIWAYALSEGGDHWVRLPGLATFHVASGADKVIAFPEPAAPAEQVRDSFHRAVLPFAVQALGGEALHASAVLAAPGAVGLCGASGAGKSTLAYALSRRGHPLWADDALLLAPRGDEVLARRSPFALRLRPAAAAHFGISCAAPELSPATPSSGPAGERVRLAALFVLERSPASEGVERLAPARAFLALLPHAYCFSLEDRECRRRMVEAYLQVAERVPVFLLRSREGLAHLPAAVAAVERCCAGEARSKSPHVLI